MERAPLQRDNQNQAEHRCGYSCVRNEGRAETGIIDNQAADNAAEAVGEIEGGPQAPPPHRGSASGQLFCRAGLLRGALAAIPCRPKNWRRL
jgi:hypothetical protein